MGTEIAISFNTLRAQLESEKSSLFKIDENIKKIVQTTGRFNNDRFNGSGDYSRSGPRLGGRNSHADASNNFKNDEQYNKRKHETKTVFSRLSARVHDSDGEEDGPGAKRARVPSAVSRELPTRAAVLRAQGDDEQARTRNRRIFGSLLGTLQKFKQEEIVLQTKEDKKALVERKIEEQARMEKEKEQKERKTLFAEREHKKATIKALEAKMGRVQEFEKWEESQKCLGNFILTKAKPHVYWIPKKMSEKATEKLESSRKLQEKYMIRKRLELQDELQRIEQRCLRMRGAGFKDEQENHTNKQHDDSFDSSEGKKRDKFAMDMDEKEGDDSDAEGHNGEKQKNGDVKEEHVQVEEGKNADTSENAPMDTGEVSEELAAEGKELAAEVGTELAAEEGTDLATEGTELAAEESTELAVRSEVEEIATAEETQEEKQDSIDITENS